MLRSFVFGAITGGLVVWLWRDEIEEILEQKTRTARTRTADRIHAVEETAEGVLDRAAAPLRHAEEAIEHGKAELGARLRAVEKTIRPEPAR
jgi:hypothetical protein